jgi:tetratricopeptide (TPR) repeat protein
VRDCQAFSSLVSTVVSNDYEQACICCVKWLYELVRSQSQGVLARFCRYHDFVANVFRDQQKYDDATLHCHKGLQLAKRLNKDEIKALLLYEWGYTLWAANRFDEAVQKYEEARRYEQILPSNLKGCLLLDTGCASGEVAQTKEQKREVMALVDRAGSIVRGNWKGDDPYFLLKHFFGMHPQAAPEKGLAPSLVSKDGALDSPLDSIPVISLQRGCLGHLSLVAIHRGRFQEATEQWLVGT